MIGVRRPVTTIVWMALTASPAIAHLPAPPPANTDAAATATDDEAPNRTTEGSGVEGVTDRARRLQPLSPAARSVVAANRAARQEPSRQAFVNATQIFAFAEGALFHVYTAPGQVTDVALQAGESLVSVAAGDTVRWVIGDTTSGAGEGKRTHLLIKPFASGLSTNAVISTDRRVYHLSLTSTIRTAMAAVSWTYPQDQLLLLQKADGLAATAAVTAGLDLERLHFDYAVSGDQPSWRPLRAFDNGHQTFIEFPPDFSSGVAPPLFVIGAKGSAELVNYRVWGRYYIVDRLFETAELRFGLKHQEIVRIQRGGGRAHRRRWS